MNKLLRTMMIATILCLGLVACAPAPSAPAAPAAAEPTAASTAPAPAATAESKVEPTIAPAVESTTATAATTATTATTSEPATESAQAAVTIDNFAFSPQTLTVKVGTTVTWTNNQAVGHTTTSDTGEWDSGRLSKGKSFSFTFAKAGTYAYHCAIHSSMTGTIEVTE